MKSYKFGATSALALLACLSLPFTALAGGVAVEGKGDAKLKLSAKAYFGARSLVQDDTTAAGVTTRKKDEAGVYVDRFYMSAKYYVNNDWHARITTDINNETVNAPGLKRNYNVFVKYAYLSGKLNDIMTLRLGLNSTPWIGYEEHLWKHRYVSGVTSDTFKFDDSSDLGITLTGKGGMFSYHVSAINGAGYSKPAATKGLDFNTRLSITPIEGLDVSAQYRTGYRGTKKLVAGVTATGTKENLSQVMISYGTDDWRAGANYINHDKTVAAANKATDKGYVVWAWAQFGEFGAFGRFESIDKDSGVVATSTQTTDRSLLGVEYFVAKGVKMSLVWDHKQISNLGNVLNAERTIDKAGLFTQLKF
ncbi:MAG: porin [Mariprofundales bacterium]